MATAVTDRALRYRAQRNAPEGPRVCCLCGSTKHVEVEHIDGHEENDDPGNLMWACRSCNTAKANTMRRAGMGRKTHQYNPGAKGATTLGEWMQAVGAITPHKGAKYAGYQYGLTSEMPVSEAVAIIRATSPAKRSQFASQLRRHNPGSIPGHNPPGITATAKSTGRAALKQYDRVTGAASDAVGSILQLPRQWAGAIVGEKNPAAYDALAEVYLQKVINKYGQDNVSVRQTGKNSRYLGHVTTYTDGSIDLVVPMPTTPAKLNTFVHECCHALMEHSREPQSKAEYEASHCAADAIRRAGLPSAKDEEAIDISNIIGGILTDINDGNRIDSRAVDQVKRYLQREKMEPDNAFARALAKYQKEHGHALI
jgi:hypothetical protein